MRMARTPYFVILFLFAFSTIAHADLPLTIEDLITDKGKVKLDISLSYFNQSFQGVATGEPVRVSTGPTTSVTLPSEIGDAQANVDAMVATLGLRYGLTAKSELYSRASWVYSGVRVQALGHNSSDSDSRFANAWVGVNYEFKEDGNTPAFLGFAEVALRQKQTESSSSLKSWMLGATTYHAIDPIVFSLTSSYLFHQVRQDGHARLKPGNLLTINPSVAFAVNDRVTLSTGFKWINLQPETVDGEAEHFRLTQTDLLLGVGYGVSKKTILNFTFSSNVSGRSGTDLRLNWLHAL